MQRADPDRNLHLPVEVAELKVNQVDSPTELTRYTV